MEIHNILLQLEKQPIEVQETFAVFAKMKGRAEMWYDFLAEVDLKELEKIARQENELLGFCVLLKDIYHGTALYPSKPLLDKFYELGFSEIELQWYIPLLDVFSACEDIMHSEDFVMNIGEVSLTISEYLHWKIWDTAMKHYDFIATVNRSTTNLAAGGLLKYFNRKKEAMHNPFKKISEFDKMMNEIFQPLNTVETPLISDSELMKIVKGNAEHSLIRKILLEMVLPNPYNAKANISLRNKCLQFYSLASLIMRDHAWETEDEFYKTNDRRRKNGKEPRYLDDYGKYKIATVKTLLDL